MEYKKNILIATQCSRKEKQIGAEYYEYLLYHQVHQSHKAHSRMLELQANGFTQTKTHCKRGGG